MPSNRGSGKKKATCDVTNVNRCWKEEHSVRKVAIKWDRIFEPSRIVDEDDKTPIIKFSIKDAVHNQYVLIPILERMAALPEHPLPYLKPLAHEFLALQKLDRLFLFCHIMHVCIHTTRF